MVDRGISRLAAKVVAALRGVASHRPEIPAAPERVEPDRVSGRPIAWRVLGLLFIFAFALRLAHVFAMAQSPYFTNPVIDAETFARIGWSIARGQGYPERSFWHPPGYPSFLGGVWWLAGDSYLAPRLVQALLGALSVVLIAWLGTRHFGRVVGLGAGLAASLYSMLIYFDAELLAPTLAIFVLLSSVAIATLARESRRRALWFAAGALGGLAGTVVATSLIVPAVLAAWARRRAHWVVLGAALVVAPVTLRNLVRGHELVLISANGGLNFWIGNNPDYEATVNIRPDLQWKRLVDEPARAGVRGTAASSRYFARKALTWAWRSPGAFLRLQLHKLRLLVGGNEIYRNHAIYPARVDSPVLAALLWKLPGLAFPFGLLLPLAAVGLAVGARRAPCLAVLVAALAAMVLVFFVTARYRVMLVPFLLIFAARAVHWFVAEARPRQRWSATGVAVLLFVVANVGQGPMERRMNADAEYSLGVKLGDQGRMREAMVLFASAVSSQPGYVEAWLNLSVCHDALGSPAEAHADFARAFDLDREAVLSWVGRFTREGKRETAERLVAHLRALLVRVPESGQR